MKTTDGTGDGGRVMSARDEVIELQRSITLMADPGSIKKNRAKIETVRLELAAQLQIVDALAKANRSLCTHSGAKHYTDRSGYPEMDCAWCGG